MISFLHLLLIWGLETALPVSSSAAIIWTILTEEREAAGFRVKSSSNSSKVLGRKNTIVRFIEDKTTWKITLLG